VTDFSFEVSSVLEAEVRTVLVQGLADHAVAANVPPYTDHIELVVTYRDDQGRVLGGFSGETFRDWLHVIRLWVDESVRGQGIGKALMAQAEAEAIKRGCHSCYLYSGSFQAPQFYPKLGYKEFVVMQDFPVGHQRIGFMKRLVS